MVNAKLFYSGVLSICAAICVGQQPYEHTVLLMGSRFDIKIVAEDSIRAGTYIDKAIGEISRIEKLISSWDPSSQTSLINSQAGIRPVKVDKEVLALIDRSIKISALTDGAFDISYASMDKIWKFDGSMTVMPREEAIAASVAKVGFQQIVIDKVASTVFLPTVGMKIGFGAIGKGYAADRAKSLLMGDGAIAGIINAAGDMNTWGRQPNGDPWKVAITNPLNKNRVFAMLPVTDDAVVTSGNYEKFVILDGKRYTHIIDPRTGFPSTGIISVTVLAPKAELADALATSVFVMGAEVGLNRINQLPNVECIIIDDQGKILISEHVEFDHL